MPPRKAKSPRPHARRPASPAAAQPAAPLVPTLADLATFLRSRLDELGLTAADVVARTEEDPNLVKVEASTLSWLLGGKQKSAAPPTMRAIAAAIDVDSRALWIAAGVSTGAITEADAVRSECACQLGDYAIVIPVRGHRLTTAQSRKIRQTAAEAVAAELAKEDGDGRAR